MTRKAADNPTSGGKSRNTSTKTRAPRKTQKPAEGPVFPVVGVGASAGGLEAFKQLLRSLPNDTGMAFVLVQHLHPDYVSALPEILARECHMPVRAIQDGMVVAPNNVYVIPPNWDLALMNGKLHLQPRKGREKGMTIDPFFRSLAADQGGRAIGIILSGTASDGVLGLKAIKAEGGITFAQDEATAEYDDMPRSAIVAGVVDFVLSPQAIGEELARLSRHPYVSPKNRRGKQPESAVSGDALEKIFLSLRQQTGHDFSYYKQSTIQRRIARRMILHKLDDLDSYVRYLNENPSEVRELFHDILINVTSFFREPKAFDALTEKVFPEITKLQERSPVRIWVPGCSTGEEAYSIAMAMLEYIGDHNINLPILIFATDIDELAVERARAGIYPENIVQDVTPGRLRQFFTRIDGGYQISKRVREICIFATQDVVRDPPFSRIDLISCRNLLIYLGPVLQKKVLRIFHYALKPDRYLFLGSSETVNGTADLFSAIDAKMKIYTKKTVATPAERFGVSVDLPAVHIGERKVAEIPRPAVDLERHIDQIIMSQYVPAAMVINRDMDILHFRGNTAPFLAPVPGEASFNLMKMVRQSLLPELSAVVREAIRSNAVTKRTGMRLQENNNIHYINIEVTPIVSVGFAQSYYLIVFQDQPAAEIVVKEKNLKKAQRMKDEKDPETKQLESELKTTKDYLQSVIEQQETTNEELRSANEEIQSSNEELQSINEELETAKEELQSTNEELATVNEELASRNDELEQVNNDLTNLVTSVDIPIVIVGPNLRIRRFTPRAEKLLNLIATDVGRPLSDLQPKIDIPKLDEQVAEVIDSVKPMQLEAADAQGHWYSVRMYPYKTMDNRIDGAVVAYIDVDRLKRSLEETKQAQEYAEAIISAIPHPLLVLDRAQRVVSASRSYMSMFDVTEKDTVGNLVHQLGNGQWARPELRAKLEATTSQGTEFSDVVVTHDFPQIGKKTLIVSGRQVPSTRDSEPMVLMEIEEVTGRVGAD